LFTAKLDGGDDSKQDKQREHDQLRNGKWRFGLRGRQSFQGRHFLKESSVV